MSKGRRIKQGRGSRWIGYPVSFLIGSLLAIAGYTYLIREKPPSKETFSREIFLVDQIIRSQLFEIGVPKKDVLLQPATSKKEGDLAREFFHLKVQIPKSLPFSSIKKKFEQNLSSLGTAVSMQSSSAPDSLRLEISVQNRVTHQLTFVYARPPTLKSAIRPRVAIVIDDLGADHQIAQEILHWDVPLTFSILPFTPYAMSLAQQAHQKGKEVILHLPMEPHGYPKSRPGEGVLLHEMDEEELLYQLSKDIEAIPFIKGVSNHMGSRIMEDPDKLKVLLTELKKRDLFFLDSRTTPQTVGLETAKSIGLRATERSLFLDHSQDAKDVKQQLEKLVQVSLTQGKAVGIGHPHPSTLKSIREMIPRMKKKGIEIVPLSFLIE